jgi:hypothetical protein
VASAAQALGLVVQVVGQDEQLKREQLLAPSTLLKAVKQMVRRLNQLAQKQVFIPHQPSIATGSQGTTPSNRRARANHHHALQDHTGLADMVRGAMACLRALGGTVRPQCATVEEACLHLLDSPHPAVRKVHIVPPCY